MPENNDLSPWLKRLLEPSVQVPLNYAITSTFFGITSGPIYGGITGIMMNMGGTPDLQRRIIRYTGLFGLLGVTYGATGVASMLQRDGTDDLTTRVVSGCSAGVALGLTNKSLLSACGACVSFAALSGALKYFDELRPEIGQPRPEIRQALQPILTSDVHLRPTTNAIDGTINDAN